MKLYRVYSLVIHPLTHAHIALAILQAAITLNRAHLLIADF